MPWQISKFWIPLTLHFQSIHKLKQSLVSGGSSQCSSSSWNGSASRGDSFFVVFIININYLCHGIYFSSCVLILSKIHLQTVISILSFWRTENPSTTINYHISIRPVDHCYGRLGRRQPPCELRAFWPHKVKLTASPS